MNSLVRKYPLGSYYALAFGISWLFWLPVIFAGEQMPVWVVICHMIGGHGPFFATLLVLFASGNREGRQTFTRSLLQWRLPWRWYALVLLGPLALLAASYLTLVALGGDLSGVNLLPPVWFYPVMLLGMTLLGGGLEEPAWRGYVLPKLLQKHSPVSATLLLGVIWSIWHLPLFFASGVSQGHLPFIPFVVNGIALSIIFTWGYLRTKGSILMAVILHGGINASLNWFPMQGEGPLVPFVAIAVVTVVVAGLLMILAPEFKRPKHGAVDANL